MKIKNNIAISETGFLFDPTTGDSFTLNPIGSAIMNELKTGKSLEEIQLFILDVYDVDKETAEKNLMDFIAMLNQHHILVEDE
jgi:hypothetical protein